MKKKNKMLLVIILLVIIIIAVYIAIYHLSKNNEENSNNVTSNSITSSIDKCNYTFSCEKIEDGTYSCNYLNEDLDIENITCSSNISDIAIYEYNSGSVFYFYSLTYYNDTGSYIYALDELQSSTEYTTYTLINSYTCINDGCNVFSSYDNEYAVIYDGNYFIYDIYNEEIVKYLDLEKEEYYDIEVVVDKINTPRGLKVCYNEDGTYQYYYAYYDIEKQEYMIDFSEEYDNLSIDANLLEKGYIIAIDYSDANYVIDLDTGDIINSEMTGYISGEDVLYFWKGTTGTEDDAINSLYDDEFNLILKLDEDEYIYRYQQLYIDDNDNLIIAYNNRFYIYDSSYEVIFTSEEYDIIYNVFKDYIAVNIDGYLSLVDYEGNVVCTMTQITSDMYVHYYISGWYIENGKNGIYMVVSDPNFDSSELSESDYEYYLKYGSSEDFGYEYYYIPETGESGRIATMIGGYAKPVLYLYPEEDNTLVTVSFEKPHLLTTTYPKYEIEWVITANKNGDLYDDSGRYYYALYWEEIGYKKIDFSKGFYVTKDNAIDFLEEKLSIIGLTEREANEFIMYWLPVLEENGQSLVYFELTEERNSYNKLIIDPVPNSLLRVAIHIKKVSEYTLIEEQVLPTFERIGFVAVEWGGVRY